MNIVYNNDGLIVETPTTLKPFASYVQQSLNVLTIESDFECLNHIYNNGIFLRQPTTFHTALRYRWVLTDENLKLLSNSVDMICKEIMALPVNRDCEWFQFISNVMIDANKVKSYIELRKLLKLAPAYVNVSHYFNTLE